MTFGSRWALAPILLAAAAGCDDLGANRDTGDTGTSPVDPGPGTWSISSHPCFGNRTDAMLWEGDTVFVGCGTTTVGYGLFRSTDRGATWSAPSTAPVGFLEAFRVTSLQRGDDGLLYIAGINTLGAERVVSAVTTSEPYALEVVLQSSQQLWNSFHVGTFRRNAAGFAVAESLTGADAAYRTSDSAPWQDGYGWWTSGNSYQILDMALHDDQFYAVGSTIGQPPHVFLPSRAPVEGFALDPVQLVTGIDEFNGELWSIDVDRRGIIAGGVNQARNVGMVFTGPLDGYTADAWTAFDVSTLYPGDTTWIRGVCRNKGVLIAVGEFSSRSKGLILRSVDGGRTFTDLAPQGIPAVHRCAVFDDGSFAVAGAEGWIGVHQQ